MTVFEAFPKAIQEMELLKLTRDTLHGTSYKSLGVIRAIIDQANSVSMGDTGTPASIDFLDLLYVDPSSPAIAGAVGGLQVDNPETWGASYGVKVNGSKVLRKVKEVGFGRNQEDGTVEHIEFTLEPLSSGVKEV